jgi:hypothetical protein
MLKRISAKEIINKLNPYLMSLIKIPNELECISKNPIELLSSSRFDIMAKYIYAKFREDSFNSDFGTDIYDNHIFAFNKYDEADGSGKKGINDFIHAFNQTLDSIKYDGFNGDRSIIALNESNIPIDGSHRLAACLLYKKNVDTVVLKGSPVNFNFEFFLTRGLLRKYADAMAYEYCKLNCNTFIAIVYPVATGHEAQLGEIFSKHGKIIYQKELLLYGEGPSNLIKEVYRGEEWLGNWEDNFKGAKIKSEPCFGNQNCVRVYVIESEKLSDINAAKQEIRKIFNLGNHSIHINDTHGETVRLSQILLNDNSIKLLNHMNTWLVNRRFIEDLKLFKNLVLESGYNIEDFCLVGSATLGILGIRKPDDIDYLCSCDLELKGSRQINNHKDQIKYYPKTVDDIIYNPDNHFYFDGIKFISINQLIQMKQNRNEKKDIQDIESINQFLLVKKKLKNHLFFFRINYIMPRIKWMSAYFYKLRLIGRAISHRISRLFI